MVSQSTKIVGNIAKLGKENLNYIVKFANDEKHWH
jgi:hypothetical protein